LHRPGGEKKVLASGDGSQERLSANRDKKLGGGFTHREGKMETGILQSREIMRHLTKIGKLSSVKKTGRA